MNYAERLNAYNEARERLRELENEKQRAEYDLTEIIKRGNWKANHDEIDAARAIRDAAAEPILAAKLRAAILRDNARRAFFEEIMPQAVAIFRRYQGGPYGEKTRRKISDEIHAATGYHCYISEHGYHSTMQFAAGAATRSVWTHGELEANLYHGKQDGPRPLLDGNKINMESADALSAYGLKEYVEDPNARAEEIRAAHEKALAARETWSAAASAYNDLIPNGAQEIDTRAGKPYGII